MRFSSFALVVLLALPPATTAVAATRSHRSPTAGHKTTTKHTTKSKVVGQRTIDDERATQIQTALIQAGYLSGTPSGHWDTASVAAMTKVQADNGWQTKLVPDSRALIKLGLGPASTAPPSSTAAARPSFAPPTLAQR